MAALQSPPIRGQRASDSRVAQRNNIAEEVIAYNSQLKDYAVRNGIAYVDYYTPMADADGGLKPQYNYDEVHVTLAAYRKMEEIILKKLSELN